MAYAAVWPSPVHSLERSPPTAGRAAVPQNGCSQRWARGTCLGREEDDGDGRVWTDGIKAGVDAEDRCRPTSMSAAAGAGGTLAHLRRAEIALSPTAGVVVPPVAATHRPPLAVALPPRQRPTAGLAAAAPPPSTRRGGHHCGDGHLRRCCRCVGHLEVLVCGGGGCARHRNATPRVCDAHDLTVRALAGRLLAADPVTAAAATARCRRADAGGRGRAAGRRAANFVPVAVKGGGGLEGSSVAHLG